MVGEWSFGKRGHKENLVLLEKDLWSGPQRSWFWVLEFQKFHEASCTKLIRPV